MLREQQKANRAANKPNSLSITCFFSPATAGEAPLRTNALKIKNQSRSDSSVATRSSLCSGTGGTRASITTKKLKAPAEIQIWVEEERIFYITRPTTVKYV